MNTTATLDPHARSKTGIFHKTPDSICEACLALIEATEVYLDCEGDYFELKRLEDAKREAQSVCELAILAHQGGRYFLSGLYRVGGKLIGMRKVGKGGLELVIYPENPAKKGQGS